MAVYTVSSSVNIDIFSAKSGSDTYNITASTLTVDQDYRYGMSGSINAAFGNINLSPTEGGTIFFDGTALRLIPYNSGSGNVPAPNITISSGSASGKLIGVYPSLTVRPQISGSAISASGFLKIKQWNGVPFGSGSLTGITVTCSGADKVGWMEIPGTDAFTATVNRLNTFKVRGAWYDLGYTDANRATTYQLPTNGSVVNYVPGVWVEKVSGSAKTEDDYEFYPCAGALLALSSSIQTDGFRGKVCWVVTASGVVRFGNDGITSTGGYLPSASLHVRIPNIFFVCCTAANITTGVNILPNATLATRYDFTTNNAGVIDIDKCCMNWYPSFTQPYSVNISSSAIMTQLLVAEIASPIKWYQIGIGQEAANGQFGLSMATCFAGGTMDRCTWTAASLGGSGRYVNTYSDLSNFTITNETVFALAARANATTGASSLTRVASSTWNNTMVGGGRILMTTCTDVTFTSTSYWDTIATTTTGSVNPMYMFDLATNCLRIKMENIHFNGLPHVQPFSGLLNVGSAGCTDIKLRNIGTYTSPLELGLPSVDSASWNRTSAIATASVVGHGLKRGDIFYTIISSDTAAVTVGTKTVTSTPSADAFGFACTNGGTPSGSMSYYLTNTGYVFALAGTAAANTVKVQRVYTKHSRTGFYTADNSSKNIYIDNSYSDFPPTNAAPQLNGTHRGDGVVLSLAAQTSCYGTHWFDTFICPPSTVTSSATWTRTTTTATVSASNHGLRTGMLISVTTSSDISAITVAQKSVTALSHNVFTIPAANISGSSGTLSFMPHNGRIGLLMNESTADTIDQYTIDGGGTAFTSVGGLYMPDPNDQITFTAPYYIRGHKHFPVADAVMAGGVFSNYNIYYSIDPGTGMFGSFHNLSFIGSASAGNSGSLTFTISTASGVEAGDCVSGSGIRWDAIVVSAVGSTVTTNVPNIGTVSGFVRFNHLPTETVNADLGFKLKLRLKTTSSNLTAITSLYVPTTSDDVTRAYQYVLESNTAALTLTGLVTGSEIRVFPSGSMEPLTGVEDSTETFIYNYTWAGTDIPVDIVIHNVNYEYIRYSNTLLGTGGLTIPIQQRFDRNFSNV